jgi:hypothetical protein
MHVSELFRRCISTRVSSSSMFITSYEHPTACRYQAGNGVLLQNSPMFTLTKCEVGFFDHVG